MERHVKHLLLRKTDVLKTLIFSERKFEKNALTLKSKKVHGISRNIYIGIIVFSCFSSTNPCLRFLLNCFLWERKGFYESSFGNWIDFRDIMNVSLNILAKKLKSQKTETLLCR